MDKGSFSYISIPHGKDCWGSATAHFECLDHYPGKYGKRKNTSNPFFKFKALFKSF